jgi:hypothetical protein
MVWIRYDWPEAAIYDRCASPSATRPVDCKPPFAETCSSGGLNEEHFRVVVGNLEWEINCRHLVAGNRVFIRYRRNPHRITQIDVDLSQK